MLAFEGQKNVKTPDTGSTINLSLGDTVVYTGPLIV